jgi:hypothetical protein
LPPDRGTARASGIEQVAGDTTQALVSLSALVGEVAIPYARRVLLTAVAAFLVGMPVPSARAALAPESVDTGGHSAARQPIERQDPGRPKADRFTDTDAAVSIVPPPGWVRSPATALNPQSDPPEPVQEVARFQIRIGDTELYAAPIPVTSGLVADATAVISIGIARIGSDILDMDRGSRGNREVGSVPGFTTLDDEATYEGLHVLTRYLFARDSDRVLVVRAAAADSAWADLEKTLRASLATFTGDPKGANAPAPAPPPPPPPPPPPAPDQTVSIRNTILERAGTLLGLRYVWGGNSTTAGMDCSAYVSWAWMVSRYTTDSIWNVSFAISKGELLPGDAVNLTIGRDPARKGHIRIFEAWANAEHSAMWVFEETPPRVVHRVVAYDDRYQPIRLAGLSGAGEVRVIPGLPQPSVVPAPQPTRRPAATPTRRPTATPTRRPSPSPTQTYPPGGTIPPRPSAGLPSVSPRPSVSPATKPLVTPTPIPGTD